MGLQVQAGLFRWLQNLSILKEGRRLPDNKIEIPEDVSMRMFDGVLVATIIKDLVKLQADQNAFQKLDAIKQNSTPAIRLYNWNILTEVLKKMGLTLQYAQKSRLLNLQPAPLLKVLQALFKHHKEDGPAEEQKPLQVDITQIPKKTLRDSSNILEFFIISISKNFKLSPQHTLNLFLDNNKYLAHLLVKGVKNSFDPIFALLSDLLSNIEFIVVTLFCTDEKQSVTFFLNAIKPSLISKQLQICENSLRLLTELHDTYKLNSMNLDIVKQWMREEGLNTIFFAIKRHPDIFNELIALTYLFLEELMFPFVEPVDKSLLWDSDSSKTNFFLKLLLALPPDGVVTFVSSKFFASWIKFTLKMIKRAKTAPQCTALISVFSWLWENREEDFESNQSGLPNAFLAFLKNCSLHQSDIVFYHTIITMFNLMEVLGNKKNPNAPFFYKILINCFTFSGISERVSFIALNFAEAFQNIKNLPGGPLVEPLIKNIEKQASADCVLLCRILVQENRMGQDELIELIEMMTSLIFYNIEYGQTIMDSIFDSIEVMNEEMLFEYLQKNSKHALAHFFSTTASIKRKFNDLKSDYSRYGKDQSIKKGSNAFTQQMAKHILLGNLVMFLQKCIDQSEILRNSSEPLIFHTYIRIKNQLKKQEQADLLMPLMKYYYPAEDQLEARVQQLEYELNPPKEESPKESPRLKNESLLKSRSIMNKSVDLSEKPKTPKPIDSSMLKPTMYAIQALEKVKKKVEHMKTVGQQNEKKKDLIQEKKQLMRSVLNEKRMVQFGAKGSSNLEYRCIYEWGTAREENPNKVSGIPHIKLVNLATEQETTFAEDVDAIIKKYRKLWRFLFFKYSSFGAAKQEMKTQEKINTAEVWKMLKEYECMILKKEESHAIVRLINENMRRKNDLQHLTYLGFEEYIFQMCSYGYNKSGFSHLPAGQKIRMFVEQLKNVTHSRGGNIELFQNPEEVYFQETDVIREFNKRLKENPEYILPEGYKKVKQVELYYDYEIHPVNLKGFSSSYSEVLEVLDEIFMNCKDLGFHVVEPLTHKQQKNLAKPSLFQNIAEKIKDHHKGYLLPKKSPPNTSEIKERQNKSINFKPEFHPHINFSLGIKLGLAGVGVKNRFIADEVAYWMDDLLDAVQKGSLKVENKGKKKIQNEAMKQKRASLHRIKLEQKQEEKKWKSRAASVKAEKQTYLSKKKEDEKDKRQQRKLFRQQEKQKQEKLMKKKMAQFQAAKSKLEEKRKEQESRRRKEYEKKKNEKEEYKKGVQEYFKKKKQELEEKEANMKKIKEEEKKKAEEEEEKKQQFAKKLHLSILKKQGDVLEKIEDIKKGFDEVWTSKEIQDSFIEFELRLKWLFDLLLKYEKSKISATDHEELSLNTLQFFALKFRIVPFVLEKNSLGKIFKIVGRTSENHTGVNFKGFKETLFRISVKAKDMLNDIVAKKKQVSKISEGDEEESEASPSRVGFSPKKSSLTEDYLFNAEGVTSETVVQLLKFLSLPNDRIGVEERYRQVMESKNNKPKNILIKQLRNSSVQQIL